MNEVKPLQSLLIVIQTEIFKALKAKALWITTLLYTIAPVVSSFFMYVLKDPELAEASGLLGAKAQIAGEASWSAYIMIQSQMIAVGGILVYGFITAWIFGREYADRTIKDLLALPFSRSIIVYGKFLTSFIIQICLSLYIISLGIILGLIVGLPGWEEMMTDGSMLILSLVTFFIIILSTPVAFFASIGRGYLAALGFIVVILMFSQFVTVIGYGDYFPWAIPALMSGMAGIKSISLTIYTWGIILLVSALGVGLTVYRWLFADYES